MQVYIVSFNALEAIIKKTQPTEAYVFLTIASFN